MTNAIDIILGCSAVLQLIAFLCSSVTAIAILRYPKTRSEPFNLYLVLLLFPDAFANLVFFIAYVYFSSNGYLVVPRGFCNMWIWVWFFYYACNLWLNTVVAYEVQNLVIRSRTLRRYKPPTLRRVGSQAAAIYAFATLWAFWFVAEVRWSPFTMPDPDYCYGAYESPDGGFMSPLASNLLLLLSFLLPVGFVVASSMRIRYRRLLPRAGRTRAIFVYFHRIVIVFVACYLPSAILSILGLVLPSKVMGDWVWIVIDAFIPIQAILTFAMVLSKPDVAKAFRSMLLCRPYTYTAGADGVSFMSAMSKGLRRSVSTFRGSFNPNPNGTSEAETAIHDSNTNGGASGNIIPKLNIPEWDCSDDFGDDAGEVEVEDEEKGATSTTKEEEKVEIKVEEP